MRDLLDLVHNVILINVYLDLEPRGVGILGKGEFMGYWENKGGQFTSNREQKWTDPDTARRVPSK